MAFTNNRTKVDPFLSDDATLVLLQEGVYLLFQLNECSNMIYALKRDVVAAGLLTEAIEHKVKIIDDTQWVELCASHQPIVSVTD